MPIATCDLCGQHFERQPSEGWKRKCQPCWQAGKRGAPAGARRIGGKSEVDHLREQIECLRAELSIARMAAGIARMNASPAALPADMLRRLLHLCHPDKHGNSRAATTATQWLLEQRKS